MHGSHNEAPLVGSTALNFSERGESSAGVSFEKVEDSLVVGLVVGYEYRLHILLFFKVNDLRIFRRVFLTPFPANTQ